MNHHSFDKETAQIIIACLAAAYDPALSLDQNCEQYAASIEEEGIFTIQDEAMSAACNAAAEMIDGPSPYPMYSTFLDALSDTAAGKRLLGLDSDDHASFSNAPTEPAPSLETADTIRCPASALGLELDSEEHDFFHDTIPCGSTCLDSSFDLDSPETVIPCAGDWN